MLEAHIVTSLTPGCQHLILIGDHQQLRPNPTVYDLQKNYDLDVSLFERMVTNGMLFSRLSLQHRMRPQIATMLDHIYVEPKLQNHESVLDFEDIKGVERNLFFLDHNKEEVYSTTNRLDFRSIDYIPLTNRVRGPYFNLRTEFLPFGSERKKRGRHCLHFCLFAHGFTCKKRHVGYKLTSES